MERPWELDLWLSFIRDLVRTNLNGYLDLWLSFIRDLVRTHLMVIYGILLCPDNFIKYPWNIYYYKSTHWCIRRWPSTELNRERIQVLDPDDLDCCGCCCCYHYNRCYIPTSKYLLCPKTVKDSCYRCSVNPTSVELDSTSSVHSNKLSSSLLKRSVKLVWPLEHLVSSKIDQILLSAINLKIHLLLNHWPVTVGRTQLLNLRWISVMSECLPRRSCLSWCHQVASLHSSPR